MKAITVSGLLKKYGDLAAVNDISFMVNSGEILGILGPNGSGKTTTIKSVLGLLEFDSGTIRVNGMDPSEDRPKVLRSTGAVLEGARNIYWYLSARENLLYFAGIKGFSDGEVRENVSNLLETLELAEVADKEVREFSSGMKQKCAIACAMVHDPDILILDEPTLGLDVETGLNVRHWLRSVCVERGKTILITSHDMDFIESVCDRVLIMRHGRIISHETVETLKEKFSGRFFRLTLDSKPDRELLSGLSRYAELTTDGPSMDLQLRDLSGLLPVLELIRDAGHRLIDLSSVENDLEDIFLELIREEKA